MEVVRMPIYLTGPSALRFGWQLMRDPLTAMRRNLRELGPIVVVGEPLPFTKKLKLAGLGLPIIVATGPEFNREVLSNPGLWRPVGIFPGGPRNSAARRLSAGLARMTGRRHAHYRRLLVPPLRKANVEALGREMARLAQDEIAAWPTGEVIDLWARVRQLLHTFAIGLLFGGDKDHGYRIAEMISELLAQKWSLGAWAFPVDLPLTPYGKLLRQGDALERRILSWADQKRGHLDQGDLLSIVVNSPEEDGKPLINSTIVGHMPQLFGAAFETCQNVLIWTLVLLAQHPQVARRLYDELQDQASDTPLSLASVGNLPWLDQVVKESLRILPPVPMQLRVAEAETSLAGHPVPKGARVLLSPFVTNRLPQLYSEPDCFRPERWATINPTPFEYLVFSAGTRNCPGALLGSAMVKMAVAAILMRFRVELAPHAHIDYKVRPALTPRRTIPALLRNQDGAFVAAPIRGNLFGLVDFPNPGPASAST